MERTGGHRDEAEERLDALFRAYREACPDPEPSVGFTPALWQRIERAQSVSFGFQRLARAFVTAAAAVSLVMAAAAFYPRNNSAAYSVTYVEALADNDSPELVGYVEAAYSETAEPDTL